MKEISRHARNLLKGIKQLNNELGSFPSIADINKLYPNAKESVIKKLKDELVDAGLLIRRHARHSLPKEKPSSNNIKVGGKDFNTIIIIRWISLIIGIVCTAMSIYYTSVWFMSFLNIFFAVFKSSAFIIFSVVAYEVAFLLKKQSKKGGNWLLALAIGITLFSMMTTVGGQVNSAIAKRQAFEAEQDNSSIELYNDYIARIENLENEKRLVLIDIQDIKWERDEYTSIMENIENKTSYQYNIKRNERSKIQRRIEKKIIKRDKLMEEIRVIQDEKAKLLKSGVQLEKKTYNSFFVWLSEVIKILSIETLQAIVYSIPALMLDIMAPVSLGIAVFLKDE